MRTGPNAVVARGVVSAVRFLSPLGCALVALSLWAACGAPQQPAPAQPQGQSYEEAVKMMCDVDRLAALSPSDDPLGIGQQRTAWISEHVDNPDGIYLRTILSVKPAEEQAAELRNQAKKTGLARCALADSLDETGTGGISP